MNKKTSKIIILSILLFLTFGIITSCSESPNTETIEPDYPKVNKYEVLNINKYIKNNTNNFGAITSTEINYNFDILLPDGTIESINDFFPNSELHKTYITNNKIDIYVVKEYAFDTYKTLYLTKDTAKKISIK